MSSAETATTRQPSRLLWIRSVRFQLTVLYVAVLGLLLAWVGVLVYHGLAGILVSATDAALATEAAEVTSHLVPEPLEPHHRAQAPEHVPLPPGLDDTGDAVDQDKLVTVAIPGLSTNALYLRVARADTGTALALSPGLQRQPRLAAALAALPLPSPSRPRYAFAASNEEDQVRCLTVMVPGRDYVLQVATSWDTTEDLLERLAQSLAALIVLFLILSGVGSWVLVGRAFRPIDNIVSEAERLTADRLTPVLLRPRKHTDDEVGHLTDALNAMMTRLYDAFKVQQRFTADASHELRTPLTILQGELENALARERPVNAYRETLSSSLEETRRMTRIVESLALLARADAGQNERLAHLHSRIDIETLMTESVSHVLDRAADKGILLQLESCPAPLRVRGDQEALKLALGNLLDNAITYTQDGGSITITTEATPSSQLSVRVTIADTGGGIETDDLPHIFERFYRADRARVNTGGSGLGLAIVRSVVEAHGGSVTAESTPGVGTRFVLLLPSAE